MSCEWLLSLLRELITHSSLSWSWLVCVWKEKRNERRQLWQWSQNLPFLRWPPAFCLIMVKEWICIRKLIKDQSTRKTLNQIMLALANSKSNKNSKILTFQSLLSFLRCVVQFIKQGQNKWERRTVIAKALSGY